MVELRYKNNPIEEVVCEFGFHGDPQWDWTVPGAFYEHVKDIFPERQEVRVGKISLSFEENRPAATSQVSIDAMQFWSKNRKELVQIAKDRLIINKKRPYKDWQSYKKLIKTVLDRYTKIRERDKFTGFSLRYINLIREVPVYSGVDQFSVYPRSSEIRGMHLGYWKLQGQFHINLQDEKASSKATVIITPHPAKDRDEKNTDWLLDINLTLVLNAPGEFDEITELLDLGHDKVVDIFEACIADSLREKFGRDQDAKTS